MPSRARSTSTKAALPIARIDVDHDQQHVRPVRRRLRVGDELIARDILEVQRRVVLERRIRVPDRVHARDQIAQALGAIEVPRPDLILLRVEILFAAGFARRILEELECRPVDPVIRAQRRGEQEPRTERGSAVVLQVLRQDVGRVRPHVGPEIVLPGSAGKLVEVLHQLVFRVAPREVRVRLREAELRETMHDLRSRERFREEHHLGMGRLQFPDRPFPERKGLGVRIVDAEDGDTLLHPELENALQLFPESHPVFGLEVEWIDVLVLLRRILGVLHGSVGAPGEPLGMRFHVRVVGRALERDVERDVDADLPRLRYETPKIVQRPELRMNGFVAALFRTDRPRAAHVVGGGRERVVPAFALVPSDGMDRRQVEYIESELAHVVEPRLDIAERAVASRLGARRAGKELVPAREARAHRLDDDRELLFISRGKATIRIALGERRELFVERDALDLERVFGVDQLLAPGAQTLGVAPRRAIRCLGDQLGSDERRRCDIRRIDPALEIVAPRKEVIDPRGDGVTIAPKALEREFAAPAVVHRERHRHFMPVRFVLLAVTQHARERVVTVAENVRFHDHGIADDALRRETPAVDFGHHAVDDGAQSAVGATAVYPARSGFPAARQSSVHA